VQGYDELGPKRHEAAMRLERALINQADAVVTVAPDIARDLAASYRLEPVPPVVLNAPELPTGSLPGATLRERVRLGPDVPLLVYAGSVGMGRALDMVVEAMPQIPDAHLAFVVGAPDRAIMKELTARAVELGVRDRVHVTRYVDQEHVVDFVAEATLGLTPFRHNKNTESSLPTKVREYLQAGVPQVVSDCRSLSAFVRDNGLGEVHVADDVDSFAAAVNRALRDPGSYLAGITDELRREHSWQAQGEVLLEVYRQVTAGLEGRQRPSALPPPERFDRLVLPHADGRYPCRLVVGPINAAEQGWALGRAAERHLVGVQAVNVAVDSGKAYGFRATRVMTPQERSNKDWVSQFEREVKAIRTHALLECGSSLTGAIDAAAVGGHVVRLERAGLTVGLIAYGSEVRDPSWHLARYPWSAFANADPEFVAALQTRVDTTRPVLEWLGLPTFVSTLDLLDHVPWATWVPLTVDAEEFRSSAPVLERERPVVVHAPSSQALKGSAVIDPVLTALEAEGLIEYCRLGVRPDGEIAGREEVVERLRTADVVVDQLGLGLYSTLSCEAMAAGRLVLAQVGDAIRGRSPEPVPIVEIDAATLEETVRRVVDDRESYRQVAKQGAEFALRYHDGRAAAAALAPFLGTAVRER
jgi:glycosyltransferase involved in cell wall biosynthesis